MNLGSGKRVAVAAAPLATLVALLFSAQAAQASTGGCGNSGSYTVSGTTATCTYADQGLEDTFSVPGYVSSLSVTAIGAEGGLAASGGDDDAVPGLGSAVSNTALPVGAGSTLYVDVGQDGPAGQCDDSTAGGPFDGGMGTGGAAGCNAGGGGGGSSALLTTSRANALALDEITGNPATDARLLVAGAGGGAADTSFGGNGGSAGSAAVNGAGAGGGCVSSPDGTDGGAGGVGAGAGSGGCGQNANTPGDDYVDGDPGTAAEGGAAGTGDNAGGGGGGWFGGGGGGTLSGGGGGSSYGGAGDGTVSIATASATQVPEVVISWQLAAPTLSTSASGGTIGGSVSDSATLSGGYDPSGTVTFDLYGPNDSTCSDAPVYSTTVGLSGSGTAGSGSFTPSSVGTYLWVASYSGDANNISVSGSCGASGESSTVAQATPSISTSASSGTVCGSISDSASVTGGDGPSGSVTFDAYGPNDSTCSGTPAFTSTVNLSNAGSAGSGSFMPSSPGTYLWVASYSGDANNDSVSGACGASGESSTVTSAVSKTTPKLATTVDDASTRAAWLGYETPGSKAFDTASFSGLATGKNPTGSVTYRLFDNGTCSGTAASNQSVSLNANGSVPNSADTAALNAGKYSYQASYPGDSNYNSVMGSCEPFTVVADQADVKASIAGPASAADSTSFDEVVTVANAGPAAAQDVVTALLVPSGVTVTSTGGGTLIAGSILWVASTIAPSTSDTYTVTFKVGAQARGSVGFAVGSASLLTPDPNYANNAAVDSMSLGQSGTVSHAIRTVYRRSANARVHDPLAIGRRLVGRLRRLIRHEQLSR